MAPLGNGYRRLSDNARDAGGPYLHRDELSQNERH